MGRLRVQEEKEAWIEGGEERGEGEKGGECKRPEGAAALHNQIPRWCSRMRSTLSAVRRKSRGGGVRDPAGMRALRKMHSLLSLPSLRPVTRPPLAQVLQPNPSRNSGNKPETPTRFFDWWPPRNFNRGTFQGGRIDWEKFFIRRGLGIFGVFEDFIFSWGRRGVTSRVTKNDVSCKIRGEFFF